MIETASPKKSVNEGQLAVAQRLDTALHQQQTQDTAAAQPRIQLAPRRRSAFVATPFSSQASARAQRQADASAPEAADKKPAVFSVDASELVRAIVQVQEPRPIRSRDTLAVVQNIAVATPAPPRQKRPPAPAADADAAPPAEQRQSPAASAPAVQAEKRRPAGMLARAGGVALVMLLSLLCLAFGAITVICKGPFPTAKELFVVSVSETSAVQFLARIYFSQEEIDAILAANAVQAPAEITDTSKGFDAPTAPAQQPLEIIDVVGSTFKGKLMIVQDPARIQLVTLDSFGPDVSGKRVEEFVQQHGAVAGVNAGGFVDTGGIGKGGQPLGLLIQNGEILAGSADTVCNIIGFSFENQLIVGEMSGRQALELGVRDAVYFEPTLIVNGKPSQVTGTGGGLNPRTVIGQRADGTVLLLVIDGRQPHSVGATLQDCIDMMLEYGAVNAANLDGGSSSVMVHEGEIINVCASLYGSRGQPSAFIVK